MARGRVFLGVASTGPRRQSRRAPKRNRGARLARFLRSIFTPLNPRRSHWFLVVPPLHRAAGLLRSSGQRSREGSARAAPHRAARRRSASGTGESGERIRESRCFLRRRFEQGAFADPAVLDEGGPFFSQFKLGSALELAAREDAGFGRLAVKPVAARDPVRTNRRQPGSATFHVEQPAGSLSRRAARRKRRATAGAACVDDCGPRLGAGSADPGTGPLRGCLSWKGVAARPTVGSAALRSAFDGASC